MQNPLHNNVATDANVTFPLQRRWSVPFDNQVSYPVIGGGRVFVTVAGSSSPPGYGTRLYALHAGTGAVLWGPVEVPGTYFFSALTLGNGVLYALNWDGILRAYRVADGTELWPSPPDLGWTTSPPVFAGGRLFVNAGGALHAVDPTSGAVLWERPVENSHHAGPAVSNSIVAVTTVCERAAFSLTGTPLWSHNSGCSGGGGRTATVLNGVMVDRNAGQLVRLSDGQVTGSVATTFGPTFGEGNRIDVSFDAVTGIRSKVTAVAMSNGAIRWSVNESATVALPPMVVNGRLVIALTDGTVRVRSLTTGRLQGSVSLGETIGEADEHNAWVTSGMGVGSGVLVISTAGGVVALT